MLPVNKFCITVLILIVSHKYAVAQNTPSVVMNQIDRFPSKSDIFLKPIEENSNEDIFHYYSEQPLVEFIFVNHYLPFEDAKHYCELIKKGKLAHVSTQQRTEFLAEALSEEDKELDNLWVDGEKEADSWMWNDAHAKNRRIVNRNLLRHYFLNRSREDIQQSRSCLAFTKQMEERPLYVDLDCSLKRPFICERLMTGNNEGQSTHLGWIEIGEKLFKIYYDRVSYHKASLQCFEHDVSSRLAYIENMKEAIILARQLLTGRPSLESAWFQAKYDEKQQTWTFPNEKINISMATPQYRSTYPPWKVGVPVRRGGCALLDRHVDNDIRFRETRCERLRPYICYKKIPKNDSEMRVKYNKANRWDYELIMREMAWPHAKMFCEKDGGWLAEPTNEIDLRLYIHLMGEDNKITQHAWLGGHYKNAQWIYARNGQRVPQLSNFIKNLSYIQEFKMQRENICLNIDRENHNTAMLYGANCLYPQPFICQYRKANTWRRPSNDAIGKDNPNTQTINDPYAQENSQSDVDNQTQNGVPDTSSILQHESNPQTEDENPIESNQEIDSQQQIDVNSQHEYEDDIQFRREIESKQPIEPNPQPENEAYKENKREVDLQPQIEPNEQPEDMSHVESKQEDDIQPQVESNSQSEDEVFREKKREIDLQPQIGPNQQSEHMPHVESKRDVDIQPQVESIPQSEDEGFREKKREIDLQPQIGQNQQPEHMPHVESKREVDIQPQIQSTPQPEDEANEQVETDLPLENHTEKKPTPV